MTNPASTDISLCPHCHCMTKIVGLKWCGKCRKDKSAYPDLDAQLDEMLLEYGGACVDKGSSYNHDFDTVKQALTKLIREQRREAIKSYKKVLKLEAELKKEGDK